jgi:hypothetical protein
LDIRFDTYLGLGRWKAYCLNLSTHSPEDESNLRGLLEILGGFNIKIMEKPFTVTSDPGEALGPDIEKGLEGLSYNVRYSFDICLAHGYLYIARSITTAYSILGTNIPPQKDLSTG